MKDTKNKKETPKIIAAVDLIHLNPGQRLSMLGTDRFMNRRTVLKRMLGSAAMVVIPSTILHACGNDSCSCQADEGGDHNSDGSCSCQVDTDCTCQTDTGCTSHTSGVDSGEDRLEACDYDDGIYPCVCEADSTTPSLQAKMVEPPDGATDVSVDVDGARIEFNIQVCRDSIAFDWSPSVGSCSRSYPDDPDGSKLITTLVLSNCDPIGSNEVKPLLPGTLYTLEISGATAATGERFQLSFSFTTAGSAACSCDSHSDSCSCQSYCSCQPDYCGCQFEGCPLYRV